MQHYSGETPVTNIHVLQTCAQAWCGGDSVVPHAREGVWGAP